MEPFTDAAYAIGRTLGASAAIVAESLIGRLDTRRGDEIIAAWASAMVARVGILLDVRGADSVDWSRAYVVMSNHQSHYDIPVLFAAVRGPCRMVAKQELARIPLFGQAMRRARFVIIDRADRERAIAGLRLAGEIIRSGVHVWIAPEGTRSRDGQLGPLKKGGFRLAQETGTPILPVAISGTWKVLAPGDRRIHRDVRVRVDIGPPIPVEGDSLEGLMYKVRTFLAQHAKPAV